MSEIFSVNNLEAVAVRLNCRSGQKHCTIHCIEEQLKRALKYSKLMMQKEVHQPCPNVQLYTSILRFRASFNLSITVYICM